MDDRKHAVRQFWERSSCGEVYATGDLDVDQFDAQARARYDLEPYIAEFARFDQGRGLDVLEVGVGMGADHIEWARRSPRSLSGVDFTVRAVEWTNQRLDTFGFQSDVFVADAERLPFEDDTFDIVYSWGVLHHTPDTHQAFNEVHRVLRPGGTARIMIYHSRSIVGYMLWARYALFRGRPQRSLTEVYGNHLESPGTKAFTLGQAAVLASAFSKVDLRVQLSFGDLLLGAAGQQHQGLMLGIARRLWPRALVKRLLPGHGLGLLIEATK